MALTKTLAASRFVEIRYDDTLQRIAERELGDASLWTELIAINDLAPPYLTGDPAQAGPKVKMFGDSLLVPAVASQTSSADDPTRVFLVDVDLTKGLLAAGDNGDLQLVAGRANLKQAYRNRLDTPLRQLVRHPTYGCGVHSLKGQKGTPGSATLGAQYVRSALLADPRTSKVESATATISGDATDIVAVAIPVTGSAVDVSQQV